MLPLIHVLFQSALFSSVSAQSAALNENLTNTIPNLSGPVLYYNGSGPVPSINVTSPEPEPLVSLSTAQMTQAVVQEVVAIANGKFESDSCSKCISSVEVLHIAALSLSQESMTSILIDVCNALDLAALGLTNYGTCDQYFASTGGLGNYLAQLLQKMSLATGDMQAFCYYEFTVCDEPPIIEINESDWFPPKPANKTTAPPPSGSTVPVLHFSDWHCIDVRGW